MMLLLLQLLLITVSGMFPPGSPVRMTLPGVEPKFAPLITNPTCGGPDGSDSEVIVGVDGVIVTVAAPVADICATLVAVTVTVCKAAIVAGAVNSPVGDMLHAPAGDTLQVTCWFVVPVTAAVNC